MLDIYEVEINGYPATLQLSKEDAELRGLSDANIVGAKAKAKTPANKSRTPANKAAEPETK